MSEDLASFFAKKKAKGAKKKAAIRLDEVAQHLESNLKFQENDDVASQKSDRDQDFGTTEDDPEWITPDAKLNAPTQAPGIGIFNYAEEPQENEDNGEREERPTERVKTWAKPEPVESKEESDAPATVEAPPVQAPKKAAYLPPGARGSGQTIGAIRRGMANNVDIQSEELFPSLGDADRIVKEEKARTEELRRRQQAEEAAKVEAEKERQQTTTAPMHPMATDTVITSDTVSYQPPTPTNTPATSTNDTTSSGIEEPTTPTPPRPASQQANVYQAPRSWGTPQTQRMPSNAYPESPQRQPPPPAVSRPEPTGPQPYLPSFLTGRAVDRNQLRSQLAEQQNSAGTGVYNARGEEIRAPASRASPQERPKPAEQMSWRRRDDPPTPIKSPAVSAPTSRPSPPPPDPQTITSQVNNEDVPQALAAEEQQQEEGDGWHTVSRPVAPRHVQREEPTNWRSQAAPQQRRGPPSSASSNKYVPPGSRRN